ncbi:MAG: hypothetical protein Nk1A_8450 [Endomicrobiia bacterium]|nr:MAG: hypothetical protein Nk1A_8450 [Endomicrobiia bacterium]
MDGNGLTVYFGHPGKPQTSIPYLPNTYLLEYSKESIGVVLKARVNDPKGELTIWGDSILPLDGQGERGYLDDYLKIGDNTFKVRVVSEAGQDSLLKSPADTAYYPVVIKKQGPPYIKLLEVTNAIKAFNNKDTIKGLLSGDKYLTKITNSAYLSTHYEYTFVLAPGVDSVSIGYKTGLDSTEAETFGLGDSPITITSEGAEGSTQDYIINLVRPDTNANLKSVAIIPNKFEPEFASEDTLYYVKSVAPGQYSILFDAIEADTSVAEVKIGVEIIPQKGYKYFSLPVEGDSVTITVTAEDTTVVKNYVFYLTEEHPTGLVTIGNSKVIVSGNTLTVTTQGKISVYNISGSLIQQGNNDLVATLPKGVYIVKTGNTSRKIVI